MNTIYDGSFVLGNTNELTFSAGPGIKIDSPSEGVVRIGNDETVLWSGAPVGSTSGNYITLTENASGFDSIKVIAGQEGGAWTTISEFPGYARRWEFERIAKDNAGVMIVDAAGLYVDSTDPLKWVSRGGSRIQFNSNNTLTYANFSSLFVREVRGLNRISGSNA